MGLRERNAARTRSLILAAALDLFIERGYEAATMEEVAERAELGASTLYRYFPTKDRLVLEPLALNGQMAAALAGRPEGEDLSLALGHALRALLTTPRPEPERIRQLWSILESSPAVQARLRVDYDRERDLLAQAISERTGRAHVDPFCAMTARVTMSVLELVALQGPHEDTVDNADASRQAVEHVRTVLAELHHEPPVLPQL